MQATYLIREAVERVTQLRQLAAGNPLLACALGEVKHFQAARFAATYADFLGNEKYKTVALFFLEELYSAKDYTQRDAQFAKIASALERLFPEQVVKTAVSLAQLHCLTEELDLAMAQHWMNVSAPQTPDLSPAPKVDMLGPSKFGWKNKHAKHKNRLAQPCRCDQSPAGQYRRLRPPTQSGALIAVLLATQTQVLGARSNPS